MKAEELKTKQNQPKKQAVKQSSGGGGGGNKGDGAKDGEEDELKKALEGVIVREKPNIKFEDVAGLENAKRALYEAIILPIQFPNMYEKMNIDPHKGILMYGPPGTGKSYLAKACAAESDCTFFSVSSSDLMSKFQGESERLIKTLFEMAREEKPSIIFIDEIDSLCGSRNEGQSESSRRVLTEFLVQMQGVGNDNKGVLVLGATNLPWGLDSAIRRRFVKRILIPLPDDDARRSLVIHSVKKTKLEINDEQIDLCVKKTEGFNSSDVVNLINDAKYAPLRRITGAKFFKKEGSKWKPVSNHQKNEPGVEEHKLIDFKEDDIIYPEMEFADLEESLHRFKPSVNAEDVKKCDDWTAEFGEEGD